MSVPGTYRRWRVVPNPDFHGMTPRILEAQCHDKTPFLTITCPQCHAANHVHESQVDVPHDVMAVRCQSCMRYTDLRVGMVQDAFAQMREDGWIP